MSEYLSPGVYVEEVSSGIKPIEGVGTSTGAFVGIAEKGPIGEPTLIANWQQFVTIFGNYLPDGYLAYAVYQFFKEGGTRCYVVRTCHYENITDEKTKTAKYSFGILNDKGDKPSIRVWAKSEGTWGSKIRIEVEEEKEAIETKKPDGSEKSTEEKPTKFKLTVKYKREKGKYEEKEVYDIVESYNGLTIADAEDRIRGKSNYIDVEKDSWGEGDTRIQFSGEIPKDQSLDLKDGDDGIAKDGKATIAQADYLGDEKAQNGLHAFDGVDINIVAIPDLAGDRSAILDALNYCQNRRDCFFVADPPKGCTSKDVMDFKKGTGLGNPFNSSFGALYYPWIVMTDPLTNESKLLPPSGAVVGTFSHVDSVRGVHKAPAGTPDGYLDSAVGIERIVTKGEHDMMNPEGINIIRKFPREGICIWGARTLSTDPEWKYINLRRLFLYLEKSIDRASQWVVFEPNSPALWGSVSRNITAFLLMVWRNGALFGNTPEQAFYVKVDAENNPEYLRDLGQLNIEVGVAPVKPAEFVIIKISQKTLEKK